MKRFSFLFPTIAMLILASCQDDSVNVFDKTPDERVDEAIASLKQELVAPPNGWKIKYKPEDGSGSFYVLLDFNEDDKVTIRTDLAADDGRYFEETITYRIDNSLGLELIFETYSFFSYLFELDQATFGAEYEFNYVNKTPDGALVFSSKKDVSIPSIIVFEPANAGDVNLLGITLAQNLDAIADDLDKFTSSLKMSFQNKDLALYISLDEVRRTLRISSASQISNSNNTAVVDFTTAYVVEGDRIIFDDPLQTTVLGYALDISSLRFDALGESSLNPCGNPIAINTLSGFTSSNDAVMLETSLVDVGGKSFATLSDFYFAPLQYVFDNGISQNSRILQDISGALEIHMYYGYDIGEPELLYGIGFVIRNLDGTITFALREFTPTLMDNNIIFNFKPEITLFGNQQTDANINNINTYLDALTQGDKTYVFEINDDLYEFYNPCSGWSFVFINANQ